MANPNSPDQTSATFAFFAVIGFASGFSERLATDILERAGSVLTAVPKPDATPGVSARASAPAEVVSVPPPLTMADLSSGQ
jgi:hypothetical protein